MCLVHTNDAGQRPILLFKDNIAKIYYFMTVLADHTELSQQEKEFRSYYRI